MASPEHDISLRSATEDDWPRIYQLDAFAFGFWNSPAGRTAVRAKTRDADVVVAEEDGRIVGVAMFYRLEVTVPGGAVLPMAGVTWVSVAATHLRRGILRQLFTRVHELISESGYALCGLTASQATLYERYGYGPATALLGVEVDTHGLRFRPSAPDPGGVRLAGIDDARDEIRDIHRRWCATTAGAVARKDADWERIFADDPEDRRGRTPLYFLVHADGYVSYRVDHSGAVPAIEFEDFMAIDDEARTALWRVLAGMDLLPVIRGHLRPDSPLPMLIEDPRAVSVRRHLDQLWIRLHDIPVALTARTWSPLAAGRSVVLRVTDRAFGASDASWRLTVGDDGRATCAEVTGDAAADPDCTLTLADLGAMYLGGCDARRLHHARRLGVRDAATLGLVDLLFSTERQPQLGTFF